jgi:rare lipoprotein A
MTFTRYPLRAAAALAATLAMLALPESSAASEIHSKKVITGSASWYGPGFHGRRTANGERYDMNKLTAAHKSLPFGTRVRVTNAKTGQSVVVRINDRGPFVGRRVIDLSKGAARAVGLIASGVAPVQLEILVANAAAKAVNDEPATEKAGVRKVRNPGWQAKVIRTKWSPVND